jgi:hypothetical protein
VNLREVVVEIVAKPDEARFRRLMQAHHYLGWLPKIGETLWYRARWRDHWIALIAFSSPALKCGVRDAWIGWGFRNQYDRLHLVTNNSRFVILPGWHTPNLGSRLLALCTRRLAADWPVHFGHPLLLLETFVDPARFHGTIYHAANWRALGRTRGYRRTRDGYSNHPTQPKEVFVYPLVADARARLSQAVLDPAYCHGAPKMMLNADLMNSLPAFFTDIEDPRRAQGRRHPLSAVLAISTAATLCGMRGYKAIAHWAADLGQQARARFRCRYRDDYYQVPSESIIRRVLMRVDPDQLDRALERWNALYGRTDEALAIDGKTMRHAVDEAGRQVHIMSVVGHYSHATITQKKSVACP